MTSDAMYRCSDGVSLIDEDTCTERESVVRDVWPPPPEDPSIGQWMHLAETSGAFEFWNDSSEDIYTDEDGDEA